MTQAVVLHSKLDPSVNVFDNGFESRFVVRDNKYIVYLSSFKGCNQACRMCHLTQTGQTDMTPATLEDFITQAEAAFEHAVKYHADISATVDPKFVHFNFMARGEPLLNKVVMDRWAELSETLKTMAGKYFPDSEVKFKISTIMPCLYEFNKEGVPVGGYSSIPFKTNLPDIYYSLYSIDEEFRRRWIPKGEQPQEALRLLAGYKNKGGTVVFHSAFIQGHNEDINSINRMVGAIKFFGLIGRYNIVRFNSPDPTKWVEATEEELNDAKMFLESKGFTTQIVSRVGLDVKASCGTFIETIGE